MGKLRASGGGLGMRLGMGDASPRLGFEMGPPDGDGYSAIFQDSEENPGQPMGLQNGPFSLSNHGRGLPKLRVN